MSTLRMSHVLVPSLLALTVMLAGGIALAAIVSGTPTTGVSAHVTYTQLTLSKPAVAAGDLMLASIALDGGNTVNISVPTGWTQVSRADNDVNVSLVTYWKIAAASEPASYTWTLDQQTRAVGGITPYSGIDATNPIDSSGSNSGFGTTATTTAVTATYANEQAVTFFATDVSKAFTVPTGMTQKYQLAHTPVGPTLASDDSAQATAGVVSSKSSTISGNKSRNWVSQQIALRVVPPITTIFQDDFNRADSSSTGNGWTDTYVGTAQPSGISSNRQFSSSDGGGTPWIYRTDITQTSGIAISGELSSTHFTGFGASAVIGVGASYGYGGSGYFITLQPGQVTIGDEANNVRATAPIALNDTDHFAYEWDITPAPQNWSYVYIWDATTGTKPATPTLSFTNGGSNFTPAMSGNRFFVLNGLQGATGPETLYQYFYKVTTL